MQLHICLNLTNLFRSYILTYFDKSKKFSYNFIFVISKNQPLRLRPLARVMQLNGGWANLLIRKQHSFFKKCEIELLGYTIIDFLYLNILNIRIQLLSIFGQAIITETEQFGFPFGILSNRSARVFVCDLILLLNIFNFMLRR